MTKKMSFYSAMILFCASTLFSCMAHSQKVATTATAQPSKMPYSIKGTIRGLKDTTVYLANYYGNKLYYNDTTRVNSKGQFEFVGKPYEECGKYALVMPGPVYFDFIVADEQIELEADFSANVDNLVVKKSENNKIFFDYIKYINGKRKLREPLDLCLNDSTKTEEQKKPCLDELKKMNEEVVAYQKKLIADHPNLLVCKLIKMTMEVVVPDAPAGMSDDEKKRYSYYYYRSHYWDNVDLKDPRMVRDQSFHKLIEKYITVTLPQIADTMTVEAKKLIDRTAGNPDLFKYIVHQFTYNFEASKIMCMDEGFVYMVDNYYAKGLCDWMKPEKVAEMKESADEKRHCLCGEVPYDIILPDSNGVWTSMKGLKSEYTLVVIWEATCGHCKKEVPKINDLYKKWKSKGLEVYGVHNNLEVDKWRKFLSDNHIEFTSVSRTPDIMKNEVAQKLIFQDKVTTLESLNYHQYWDVNSTPKVYLMDKNHKIIAKSLSADQLDELLQKLSNGEDTSAPIIQEELEDADAPANGQKFKPRTKGGK
jgi:thiol-disulfide isomerase/thioredoxin